MGAALCSGWIIDVLQFLQVLGLLLIGCWQCLLLGLIVLAYLRKFVPLVFCIFLLSTLFGYLLEQAFLCLSALYNSVQQDSLAFSLFKGVYSLCLVMSVYMYCWSPACFLSIQFLHLIKKKKDAS
jgi:hypothetical protein